MRTAKDLAFWLAAGLAGAATVAMLKWTAARFNTPGGFARFAGSL